MSVRVVARIRPLLKDEIEKDVIVDAARAPGQTGERDTVVRIPNPKKESELYTFEFSSVYGQNATQQEIFEQEVSPTVKHLFKGFDVTLFAYGVTGTGKTHTMRGGKTLADRGVIPRLLSSIYRRARKTEKDSEGNTHVEVSMSYYEIYNDRVFDLFEPPEKRTPAGLPIRDTSKGKAVVVGLTERPCTSLKDFEQAYDEANVNRSTSATKLNAHSSRSHAILCVKVTQFTGEEFQVSTASCIDLAGSEDNRRTDNNKERLVESSAINKSLFVLASCVEAISQKKSRIPYRESKMTRILALGQNNGLTVMILNLAPVRSYHLDTLSSLNFANRTKKIEVNEIENQPFFREGKSKDEKPSAAAGPGMNRQPLRPKLLSQNSALKDLTNVPKPVKQFAVFADKPPKTKPTNLPNIASARTAVAGVKSPKRVASSEAIGALSRPSKSIKPNSASRALQSAMTSDSIEALIERKVAEALAGRKDQAAVPSQDPISDEVQKRLDALEKRVEGQETERAEGLQYLLMAKQHQVRGEDASALKMYQLALPYFPGNQKLVRKVAALQDKIAAKLAEKHAQRFSPEPITRQSRQVEEDESYHEDVAEKHDDSDEDSFSYRLKSKPRPRSTKPTSRSLIPPSTSAEAEPAEGIKHSPLPENDDSDDELATSLLSQTPRTKQLLSIINTKDVSRIKLLKGVGAKKAESIVNCLCDLEDSVTDLGQLGKLKGVGVKTVENMRNGLAGLEF